MAKRPRGEQSDKFGGFDFPESNYSKLPHALIGALPLIKTGGEMKVILYVLRHTWGFHEDSKRITLDEFENGRIVKDTAEHKDYPLVGGKRRMDGGVGMCRTAIRSGIVAAVGHGFLNVEKDDHDMARQRRLYSLRMQAGDGQGVKDCPPGGQKMTPRGSEIDPRSEKDTFERNAGKTPSREAPGSQMEPVIEEQAGGDVSFSPSRKRKASIEVDPEDQELLDKIVDSLGSMSDGDETLHGIKRLAMIVLGDFGSSFLTPELAMVSLRAMWRHCQEKGEHPVRLMAQMIRDHEITKTGFTSEEEYAAALGGRCHIDLGEVVVEAALDRPKSPVVAELPSPSPFKDDPIGDEVKRAIAALRDLIKDGDLFQRAVDVVSDRRLGWRDVTSAVVEVGSCGEQLIAALCGKTSTLL